MTRDGEISAIFNPRRVRAPSVVVTGDSPNGQFGGFTNIISAGSPHLIHSDSIASGHPDGIDSTTCIHGNNTTSAAGTPTPTELAPSLLPIQSPTRSTNKCKDSCCSELAQKVEYSFIKFIQFAQILIMFNFLDVLWRLRYNISDSIMGWCNALHKIFIYSSDQLCSTNDYL